MPKNRFYDKYAKTKKRLFILFIVMTFISLGAGIGIRKLSSLETVGTGLETVYEDRVLPLRQLKKISDIYGIHVVDAANKVLIGNISWEKGRVRLGQATTEIPALWNEYLKTYLIEDEKRVVDELSVLFKESDKGLARLGEILLIEDRQALSQFIQTDLYEKIEPVTQKIDELFQIQVRVAKEIHDKEKKRYKYSLGVGSTSLAVSMILCMLVLIQWKRLRALLDYF